MPKPTAPRVAEQALLAQLSDVERRIADLQDEKRALERLLARVRGQNVASEDVTRKNSTRRLVIEKAILDKLSESEKSIFTSDLYRRAKSIMYAINESTFGSYLFRIKMRGLIITGRERASWTLPTKTAGFLDQPEPKTR